MEQSSLEPNPLDNNGIFSKITFSWLLPLFKKGYERPLKKEDLFQVRKNHSSVILGDLLSKNWNEESSNAKASGRKRSFTRALLRTFGLRFFWQGMVLGFDQCIVRIFQALLLGGLIKYFNKDSGFSDDYIGLLFATGIVISEIVKVVLLTGCTWSMQSLGMEIRIATCNMLYRKTLRLSNTALQQASAGQIVNLLSNDINRFDVGITWYHAAWYGPVQAIIIIGILWQILGPSCFVAMIFLIFNIPLQGFMSKLYSRHCLATALLTDERIELTNEVMNSMRLIKMYCWDGLFETMVTESRRNEVNILLKTHCYHAFIWAIYFICGKLVLFSTLLVYILLGNNITSDKVFVTMVLIDLMNATVIFLFSFAVTLLTEIRISCDRIQKFLDLEECEESDKIEKCHGQHLTTDSSIWIIDVSARWCKTSGYDDLKGINFRVTAGQLLAVVGPVGSGKSSLLLSIIGELPIKTGSIKIKGKIAYVSQEPWIINGTIKQNILFGQPFHDRKYRQVIKVCALEKDLELLPDKDQTIVGEKGDSLSGGQKARISLARAVYYDADIYLLDDPLSAVDAHVGRHLFRQCISKFLSTKVCILVTHQLQYLKAANQILVLRNGIVRSIGTPVSLRKKGADYGTLISVMNDDKQKYDEVKNISRQRSKSCWEMGEKNITLTNITRFRRASQAWNSISGSDLPFEENFGEGILEISSAVVGGRRMTLIEDYEGEILQTLGKAGGEERKVEGKLNMSVYFKYFKAGGGSFFLTILAAMFFAKQILFVGVDYWLVYWLRQEREFGTAVLNVKLLVGNDLLSNITSIYTLVQHDRELYLYVYAGLVAALITVTFVQSGFFAKLTVAASFTLHKKMVSALFKTNMSFYDKHSVGQILNRFSNDLGRVDSQVPINIYDFIIHVLYCVTYLGVICYLNYWIVLPALLFLVVLWFLRSVFMSSAREIRRLEGTMRSPVFSHLSSSIQGLATIRSCDAQKQLIKEFEQHQDMHTSVWFLSLAMTACFAYSLELLSVGIIAITTFSFFGMEGVSGNEVGWSISTVFSFALMFVFTGRRSAELESIMISVERVIEYTKLEPEDLLEGKKEIKKSDWPNAGKLSFQAVNLYYDQNELPILKNVTFSIKAGEKIGIVGRTGAGKSSLLTCLMRLAQSEGTITIDNINTDSISFRDLRESISIIPQNPILFKGTIRHNLDPFSNFTDEELWKVMEEVELKEMISKLPDGLSALVTQGGDNFSIGQRQLVCLARAILKHNKILVMDEATANVDQQTDSKIQNIIRLKFADCTVLTIAHRINTIIDSDKVLVMEAGEVREFSSPHELLQDDKSLFSEFIRGTDPDNEKFLREAAKEAYNSQLALVDMK